MSADEDKAARIAEDLRSRGIGVVALTWVDNSGITRVKGVPVGRLERAVQAGVGVSPVFDAFGLTDGIAFGRYAGGPVGDLRLRPDLDRLVPLAAQPGWAWAPADRFDQLGRPHPQDAREVLRRQVDALAGFHGGIGFQARAGIEIEWNVYAEGWQRFSAPGSIAMGPAYGMDRVIELSDYLRDVVQALTEQGLVVEQIHPEYAPGQFEVSVEAEDPLGAADSSVLVRQTVRAVGARHKLRTSFSPAVVPNGVGNGGHVHLSLGMKDSPRWNALVDGTGPAGLSQLGERFAAGILGHLPALLAVGAPSVASYLRLAPSRWSGAFACWGVENREAALRLVTGLAVGGRSVHSPDVEAELGVKISLERWAAASPNLEIKCFDLTANPYLLLAGLLAAGRSGVAAHEARLPEPVDVDPASLTEEERARRGIAALPARLADAVTAFEGDSVLLDAFGAELHDTILVVRRAEIDQFADATPDEIVAQTLWRH
ncbi:glutamine synthetase family protein [Pseudofrankia sp. BMG5.36]|uniref:glutamine synthetase family protein n=1 Tax=Pseudofrankia sp. BMG5.36 TaxID=1834512 RepID=UPI0008DA24A8|nr:glutamine synthetase family protein [Pseudofrankia sp. BMG5.36]OHV42808.1 glutamine synthetase [Pseudofrankia sp. BMG5.36]